MACDTSTPPAMASQQPPTQPTSANVEMNNLATGVPSSLDADQDTTAGASQMDGGAEFTAVKTNTNTSEPVATAETSHQEDPTTTTTSPLAQTPTATSTSHAQVAPVLTRKETEALGPATEAPIAPPPSTAGPALSITLMLTTGARHPYKIDEKYLRNRKVEARNTEGDFDPRGLSGYQLKELVWTDWRTEWEPRPASPSSIRLIILGRMIEDKALLKGKT